MVTICRNLLDSQFLEDFHVPLLSGEHYCTENIKICRNSNIFMRMISSLTHRKKAVHVLKLDKPFLDSNLSNALDDTYLFRTVGQSSHPHIDK